MTQFLLFATILSGAAIAQEFPASGMRVSDGGVTATFGPPRPGPLVTGAPYSAEQQLPNGGVVARYARDSQGRVRTEKAHKVKLLTTAIFDPVAGCAYLLDEDSKIAHRMKLPAAGPSAPSEDNLEIGVVRGFRMARLSRAEPDPSLFRPPSITAWSTSRSRSPLPFD
jgi:hypothetical protein